MTLKECLDRIEEIQESWPNGINSKSKSIMVGFSLGSLLITISQAESEEWGIEFESMDEEFNENLIRLFDGQTK